MTAPVKCAGQTTESPRTVGAAGGATQEASPMSSEGNKVERRYALIRVETGVYLLPSNDRKTLWRITSYTEEGDGWWELPDGKAKQIKGTFWQTARRPMPTQDELNDDDFLWDYDKWEWWSSVCPTRREAIEDALRA